MSLLFNPKTKQAIESFITQPSHAVLIDAPSGSGKATTAGHIASQLLGIDSSSIDTHPYVMIIEPEKGSISVESIRKIRTFLSLKVPSNQSIARAIIILESETMTTEAQNALLKTLEEPPKDTVLILTSSSSKQLLDTVRSRVRLLKLLAPALSDLQPYFTEQGSSQAEITKAFLMSDGRIGLMVALLDKETEHPLVAAIDQAKRLLGATNFERLAQVDQLAKDKESLPQLLEALERISHAGLHSASQKQQIPQVTHWQKTLKAVLAAQEQIAQHASTKLVLSELMLNI